MRNAGSSIKGRTIAAEVSSTCRLKTCDTADWKVCIASPVLFTVWIGAFLLTPTPDGEQHRLRQ